MITGRPPRLSKEQEQEVVDLYKTGKYSHKELGERFGFSAGGIQVMMRKWGIKGRSHVRDYTVDETFFDAINTEEKAYFLGLMYADGYNYETRNRFKISLQERDKEILEKFAKCLGSNAPLNLRKKETVKHQNQRVLAIYSERLSKNLKNLGCHQTKSLTLKFPASEQIPEHLLRHFIRGYFDGDGCFYSGVKYINNRAYLRYAITIVSTKIFCKKLQEILQKELHIFSKNRLNHADRGNMITTVLGFEKMSSVFAFLDWIYADATVYLERKYQHYLKEKSKYVAKGTRWQHKVSRLQKESVY